MTSFERIRYTGKTIYLSDPKESGFLGKECLEGYQVNKEANIVTDRKGAEQYHIIQRSLITKRTKVYFNGKYGTLEKEEWKP
jgi:hypothetical protein